MELKATIILLLLIKGAVSFHLHALGSKYRTLSKMLVVPLTAALLALSTAQRYGQGIRK
jgi:hypothetical protein